NGINITSISFCRPDLPAKESSVGPNKESNDKGQPSPTATAHAPSSVSSKPQEKTSFSGVLEDTATAASSVKTAVSRVRPGSSASSTSESGNAPPTAAASSRGLSPSSSIGSLTSEKSTLNPHAKEFRLNPNAKSFVPSPAPVRAPSPVSDGSFYYPANVAPVPHMHGMPVGMGMGPSFPPHQPVMYGPQGTPLQSPQTYFNPNAPQYGQHMLLGQPRQVVYMPTYPPIKLYEIAFVSMGHLKYLFAAMAVSKSEPYLGRASLIFLCSLGGLLFLCTDD
ncbi:hypothetical protein Tco_0708603, partial [Tanacetum coccineum]